MTTDAIDLYVSEVPGDDGEISLELNFELRTDDDEGEIDDDDTQEQGENAI